MDVVSLALAVDSTQVNSASQALGRFAEAGTRAESASSRLERAHAAMLAEMQGIGRAVQELVRLSAAQAAAATTAQKLSSANIDAANASNRASTAIKQEAQAIQGNLTPAATQGAAAMGKLSLEGASFQTAGIKAIGSELSAVATQATRTMAAVGVLQAKVASVSFAPSIGRASTPIATPITTPTAARTITPVTPAAPAAASSAIAAYTANANSARSAIDRLTASARNQASALGALAPAAAATAASYRAIATNPITVQPPAGLEATTAALRAATDQLQRARSTIGGTGSQTTAAGGTGTAPSRTQPTPSIVPQTAAATAASRALAQAQNEQGRSARFAAFQQQQLGFQLHDFFVQVVSGQSPLTAFVQQGSQLSGTFGGAGNAFRAIIALITPARVAMAGLVGVAGGLAYAFYRGKEEAKELKNSIVLSGNFAGQTPRTFNQTVQRVAGSTRATVGQSREVAEAILQTGEFGPATFEKADRAAVTYQKVLEATTEQVSKDFADLGRAPAKFAIEHNRAWNFISAAQIKAAQDMEESGNVIGSQNIVLDALQKHLDGTAKNADALDKSLDSAKKAFSAFWAAVKGSGEDVDAGTRIERLQAKIKLAERGLLDKQTPAGIGAFQYRDESKGDASRDTVLQKLRADLAAAQAEEKKSIDDAKEAAKTAETNRLATEANKRFEAKLARAKPGSELKKAQDQDTRDLAALKSGGLAKSASDVLAVQQQTLKDHINPEAGQLLRAALDRDLKSIQDIFQRERDTLTFQNKFLQGEYQNGQASLHEFFRDKRETAANAVDAEILALDKERARLEQYKRQTPDPSERVQTQTRIDEIRTQQGRLRTEGNREQALINQEATASFKALSDQISNYRANLLQMEGDEEGAAKIRADIAIQNARILARQAEVRPGATPIDVAGYARAIQLSDQFAAVQRRAQLLASATTTAENAFILAAEQRGASLKETEQGVYTIRARELQQLGELAAKAKELADASTDPRIKQFAADLALEYAKAAAAVDPALNRLRDATKQLAADLANTVTSLPQTFADAYARRRQQSLDDIQNQKSEFDRRIDILEGYLAETQDKQDKARLRAKIKDLQSQKDSVKKESRASSILGAVNASFIQPVGQQISQAANKVLIADPLQKYLESQLKGATEGEGTFAKALRDAIGVKVDPKDAALATQTAAIQSSTTALTLLEAAARGAADGLTAKAGGVPAGIGKVPSIGPDSETGDAVDAFGSAIEDTTSNTADLARIVPTASDVITKLAVAGGSATQSLALLPSIISLISASSAASAASSAGGGLFGGIAKIFGFGGGGGGEAVSDFGGVGIFHSGGIASEPTEMRYAASSAFAGARRYHTGGLIGRAADGIKHGEVPAILLPDEEVLKRSDPRHRHNLASGVFAAVQAADKKSGDEVRDLFSRLGVKQDKPAIAQAMAVRGNREIGGPVSAGAMYRVNERGPELLQVAGRQYLMMGSQSGKVESAGSASKGDTHIHQHFNISTGGQPVDRRTIDQMAAAANMGARRATVRNG